MKGISVNPLLIPRAAAGKKCVSRGLICVDMRQSLAKILLQIAAALVVTIAFTSAHAQRRSLMTPADTLRVATVGDAQISPNGQWVVYSVATVNGNETINTLWLARLTSQLLTAPVSPVPPTAQNRTNELLDWPNVSGSSSPLLGPDWQATNPRWSPDSSKIAFLSGREGQRELRYVTLERREPRLIAPLTSTNFFITYAGEQFAWSPDSKRIAFITATEEPENADQSRPADDDPRVIDRIRYKSRTSFSDRKRTHVWIATLDRPEPRQLTFGLYYDHAVTFSPNGNEVAYLSNHESDPDAINNSDIFTVDMSGQVRQITTTKGCEYEPTWSPDGKWIAYTATKRDVTTIDSIAEDTHVWVTEAGGSTQLELTSALSRRARNPHWSSDSKWIFFIANDRGRTRLYRVDPSRLGASGSEGIPGFPSGPTTVTDARGNSVPVSAPISVQLTSFSLGPRAAADGMPLVTFTQTDSSHAAEVWVAIFGRLETALRLSGHNDSITRTFQFAEPELLSFRSFDGVRVEGWLMKPAGWRADRKYPLILSIHGGPHGMYGAGFSSTFQVYSARGYAVLFLNPRGSNGYGQKFSDGTLNEWGGGDYKDLMAGVDEALRKYSWIDQGRLGVTGGSYGGFMTNWIITQTPRFKAAVAVASLSNLISFYSTSLYQDLIHAEFGGYPWDNYELLWQWSPLKYIKQAQTPTLLIHGEQDNDVHITQAEEMYTALRQRGVESVLVRYPREGHGFREPRHRVDALERTLAWFDRFLK